MYHLNCDIMYQITLGLLTHHPSHSGMTGDFRIWKAFYSIFFCTTGPTCSSISGPLCMVAAEVPARGPFKIYPQSCVWHRRQTGIWLRQGSVHCSTGLAGASGKLIHLVAEGSHHQALANAKDRTGLETCF
jgi:hypothetical protein